MLYQAEIVIGCVALALALTAVMPRSCAMETVMTAVAGWWALVWGLHAGN